MSSSIECEALFVDAGKLPTLFARPRLLLPHSMREWLTEGYLVYFINDTVESLELRAFHARYAVSGSPPDRIRPARPRRRCFFGNRWVAVQ